MSHKQIVRKPFIAIWWPSVIGLGFAALALPSLLIPSYDEWLWGTAGSLMLYWALLLFVISIYLFVRWAVCLFNKNGIEAKHSFINLAIVSVPFWTVMGWALVNMGANVM